MLFFYWLTKGQSRVMQALIGATNRAPWLACVTPSPFLNNELVQDSDLRLLSSSGETPPNPSTDIPNWLQRDTSQLIGEKCSELQSSEAAVPSSMYEDSGDNSIHVPTPVQSKSPGSDGNCACIFCMKIGVQGILCWCRGSLQCRVVGCTADTVFPYYTDFIDHEKAHFENNGKYHCREARCTSSFNRWVDLLRHTKTKHCLNSPRFYCSEIDCQYHSGKGFTRKDKLQSHEKNMHQGRPKFTRPAKPVSIAPRQ